MEILLYYLYAVVLAGLKAPSSKALLQCTVELTGECFGNGQYYSLSAVPLIQKPFQEQSEYWSLCELSTEQKTFKWTWHTV